MHKKNNSVIVQWVGDISLNGQFCSPQYHQAIADQMAKLRREAGPCDLRVGNFEAPLWGDGSVNELRKTRICTTIQAAQCILPLGLDLVFLGNNHVYDCREKGFENTIEFLQKHKIKFLGAGRSQSEAAQPVVLKKRGISLGFLNYVHRNTNPSIPPEAGVFLNYFDEKTASKEIAELTRKVDVLLLYLHWGAQELMRLPSLAQRRFGRRAVEMGTTVVVFDHAHCLHPREDWRAGHIFYGLGNFIFGDIPGQNWPDLAYRTAVANITLSRSTVESVRLDNLYRKDCIPVWDDRKSRLRSQKRLNHCIRLSDSIYSILYSWEKLSQLTMVAAVQFIRRSGGIIPSLLRIRKRHFRKIFRAVAGSCRGTS